MSSFRKASLAAAAVALALPVGAQTPAPAAAPASASTAPQPTRAQAPAASPAPVATPSPQAVAEGKALLAKVIEAMGGRQKVAAVKDVRTRGRLTAKTPEGEAAMEVQSSMIFPDYLMQKIDSPFGRVAMVASPSGAFLVGPTGSQDLPPAMASELRRQMQRVPLQLAQRAIQNDPKLSLASAGKEKVGEVDASILDVRYESTAARWFLDPVSGRILRTSHTGTTPDGKPVAMVSDYLDYKIVEGFPVAHRLEVTTNGEKDQTLVLEECKFNSGIDPKMFEKPPAAPAQPHPPGGAGAPPGPAVVAPAPETTKAKPLQ
jgi:hypothetical protein